MIVDFQFPGMVKWLPTSGGDTAAIERHLFPAGNIAGIVSQNSDMLQKGTESGEKRFPVDNVDTLSIFGIFLPN